MLWAYFAFSQFLIIWAGNLPEEIPFFVNRFSGGWQYVSLAMLLGHFALPFVLLLSRDLKKRPQLLAKVAVVHPGDAAGRPGVARRADVRARRVPHPLDGRRAADRASSASGSSCSRARSAAGRCCRSTIPSSRRRSRMTSTDRVRATRHHYSDAEMHNHDVAHEDADVDIRTILEFGVGIAVVVVAVCVRADVAAVPRPREPGRRRTIRSCRRWRPTCPVPTSRVPPPAPHLQTNEPEAFAKFRMEERKPRGLRVGRSGRRASRTCRSPRRKS